MLPEEIELQRLQGEQTSHEESVAQAELDLETLKTEVAQFRRRYNNTVGRLYAEIDRLKAIHSQAEANAAPHDQEAASQAQAAHAQAAQSAQELGLSSATQPEVTVSPELKAQYRKACKLMHPDRATTDVERIRRNTFMAQANVAYEAGNLEQIQKLIHEFGIDPEALVGQDLGTQIVKAIRRIAQLRRRLSEIEPEIESIKASDMYELKSTVEESEVMGGDPLGDLAQKLLAQISDLKIEQQSKLDF